jgi:voltage-gated potassium channel
MNAAAPQRTNRQATVARLINLGLALLAVLFAVLFILQFAVHLDPRWQRRLNLALTLIWAVFVIDFFVRLVLAPSKGTFLRHNWIMAIAACMPALGVLRIFAVARAVPALQLGGLAAGGSRGSDALRRSIGAHQSIYVGGITVFLTLLAAAGMVSIVTTRPDANIQTFGEAVWWCAATLTTIGSELYPVSWEGRTLAVFVMIYGLVFAGYVTATLAVFLHGPSSSASQQSADPDSAALLAEIQALRAQLEESNGRATLPAAAARPENGADTASGG